MRKYLLIPAEAVDDIALALLEDHLHGEDGKIITQLRGVLEKAKRVSPELTGKQKADLIALAWKNSHSNDEDYILGYLKGLEHVFK